MAAPRTIADGEPRTSTPRSSTAQRRRERKREILKATRTLFDERGLHDAQIDDIARAAGINRAIVYRHFASKDEIFALTLAGYLEELKELLQEAAARDLSHVERFAATVDAFAVYAMDHPAFVDCAQALTSQRWSTLRGEVPAEPLLELGQLIADCLSIVVKVLDDGTVAGEFRIADPALLANMLYASGLGALQQARLGAYITYGNDGAPIVRPLSRDRVRQYLREAALAATRRSRPVTD